VQIDEEELIAVTKNDIITMKFNKTANSVILELIGDFETPDHLN